MAIIGFFVLVCIGVFFFLIGLIVLFANSVLGGNKKGDLLTVFILLIAAYGILNWAYHNSPFTVSLK